MLILWDEPKRLANIDKHGLDFRVLNLEFFELAVVIPARLGRLKAIGRLADGTVAVIFVHLGTAAVSVISMRTASNKERRLVDAP